jgi:hypothetical protein
VLENEYLWAISAGRRSLWSPGFFFPVPNVAAFGDVELGSLPFYAPWRLLGCPYDTAFQLWCMTSLSLDFVASVGRLLGRWAPVQSRPASEHCSSPSVRRA